MSDPAFLPFLAMQATRFAALMIAMVGVAIVAEAWNAPFWLGVVLTLGGTAAFFFAPRKVGRALLARTRR